MLVLYTTICIISVKPSSAPVMRPGALRRFYFIGANFAIRRLSERTGQLIHIVLFPSFISVLFVLLLLYTGFGRTLVCLRLGLRVLLAYSFELTRPVSRYYN